MFKIAGVRLCVSIVRRSWRYALVRSWRHTCLRARVFRALAEREPDDRQYDRELLVTLLGYKGHTVFEATSGAQGLNRAHDIHPDLVITDILMPEMDGFEFLRRLREDRSTSATPVILTSGHYFESESRDLTHTFEISAFLKKPSDPEDILRVVDEAIRLGLPRAETVADAPVEFEELHRRAINNKLCEEASVVDLVKLRLAKLAQFGQQIVSVQEPLHLLDSYCQFARDVIGAKWAILGLLEHDRTTVRHVCTSGLNENAGQRSYFIPGRVGIIAEMIETRASIRCQSSSGEPAGFEFPPDFPVTKSFSALRLCHRRRCTGGYAWATARMEMNSPRWMSICSRCLPDTWQSCTRIETYLRRRTGATPS